MLQDSRWKGHQELFLLIPLFIVLNTYLRDALGISSPNRLVKGPNVASIDFIVYLKHAALVF